MGLTGRGGSKKEGEVRVCIDIRQVNKAIKREQHITPTIGEIISDLNGATLFSKWTKIKVTKRLRRNLKKYAPFTLTKKQKDAVQTLRKLLIAEPESPYFDSNSDVI